MNKSKELDQFYTTKKVAQECVGQLERLLSNNYDLEYCTFLEPSAGTGAFIEVLQDKNYQWVAGDLDPQYEGVQQVDFLSDHIWELNKDTDIIIGNPPFGKRASLAVDFINRGLEIVDTVAFILPIQFNKYLTQKRINNNANLLFSEIISLNSFIFNGKPYSVRTVFQVWSLRDDISNDQRIRVAPPTKHDDFQLEYYNCVPEKLYLFNEQWDFVILRQGWDDFIPIELDDYSSLSKKKQWMFFRAKNQQVLDNLKNIDYNKLADKNTAVRGFGKADIINEYNKLYPSI